MPIYLPDKKDDSPYRPSNGTEGIMFMAQFCDICIHDSYPDEPMCDIVGKTMAYDIDDPKYPKEWIFKGGRPFCTKFERKE